jgi:large subunit ribosomal protein L3
MSENLGLFGIKVGMTQIYSKDGAVVPVTVVDVSGNTVLRVKTKDSKDGYNALQIGVGERRSSKITKPMQGEFDKINVAPTQHINELRVTEADVKKFSAGQVLKASEIFKVGEMVDATGTSKGRGFAGVMKKYNFRGFIRTHGTHEFFRHGGSIGTRLTPGHVMKGKKMPGHMGAERVTVQNLSLVKIDDERNLVFIKGGVPGPNKGFILVRKAVKA